MAVGTYDKPETETFITAWNTQREISPNPLPAYTACQPRSPEDRSIREAVRRPPQMHLAVADKTVTLVHHLESKDGREPDTDNWPQREEEVQ